MEVSRKKTKVIFVNRFYCPDHSATSQILTDLSEHLALGDFAVTVISTRLGYDVSSAALPNQETHHSNSRRLGNLEL